MVGSYSILLLFSQCNSVGSLEAIAQLLADIVSKSRAWILDIDLDFFSTGNPYRGLFTSVSNKKNAIDECTFRSMHNSGMSVFLIYTTCAG